MFPILFIAIAIIAMLSIVYDIMKTEDGLERTSYVEQFTWLVGRRPSPEALYLRDAGILGVLLVVVLLLHCANAPLGYGALIGPVLLSYKHVRGARQWVSLMNGGTLPDPTIPLTAWQKFWRG